MDEEVNRDENGEADGMNLEVDSNIVRSSGVVVLASSERK